MLPATSPHFPLTASATSARSSPRLAGQLLRQLRVAHWVKNATVLLPAFFAGRLLGLGAGLGGQLALAFGALSLLSSFIYLINDLVDVAADRQHPLKRHRPYASGFFSKKQVLLLAAACLLAGLGCVLALRGASRLVPLGYLALNMLYCFSLKQLPLVDVTCISAGFVLRLVAGGLATAVPLSHWIVIMGFLLAFSMALAKRRDDLVLGDGPGLTFRAAQAGYTRQFIDVAKGVSFAVTLVAYLLYTLSPEVQQRLGSPYVYVTALPVFLGIMRYLQLSIVQEVAGSPVRRLFGDPFLLLTVLTWLGLFYYLIYG